MFKCATLSIKMRCREEGEAGVGICLYELLSQQANQRPVLLGQSEGSECVMANQRAQNVTLTSQRAQNVTLTNQRARIVRGTRQILIMLPIRQVTSPEAKSPFPFLGWTFRELGLGLWTGTCQ